MSQDGLKFLPVPDPPEERDDEDMNCGKTGHRGQCGHCEECACYGDAKYHEAIDRMIEREG